MKKIGMAVCYDTKNFGSQLQVLANDRIIRNLGYETEIIVYKKRVSFVFLMQLIPRFFNPFFLQGKILKCRKKIELAKFSEVKELIDIRNKRFVKFAEENFSNISRPYKGWQELSEIGSNSYDGFLCGSDQLWLPSNLGSHFYTLEFITNSKTKIAYATSFGVANIPWYQEKRTKKYLSDFTCLSCREEKGVEIINACTGRHAPVVCDPTLLFTREEWSELIPNRKIIREKYIFCYFLGVNEEHRKIANELKLKTGYRVVTIPFLDNFVKSDLKFGDEKLYDVDASDFINLIRNAEFVLTDSFHGTIFSILNRKKFIVLDRFLSSSKNSRNSRIDSLCNMLSLHSRRYKGDVYENIVKDIDYDLVEQKLKSERGNSLNYLKKALENV